MSDDAETVEVAACSVTPGDDREYERVVVVEATLTGPRGDLEIERRYEALPRHNDVVAPEVVESNDEFLASADAVHVYTQWFAAGEYLGDEHAIWEPTEVAVLGDDATSAAACRDHVERTAARTYATGFDR